MRKFLSILLVIWFGLTLSFVPDVLAQSQPLPDWYVNPPANDALYLYGVGEGAGNPDAIAAAMEQIASALRTSIQSSLSVYAHSAKTDVGESSSEEVTQHLKSEVAKIQFNNYQLLKSAVVNDKTYVLIEVEKKRFVDEKKLKFNALNDEIHERIGNLKQTSIIEQIRGYDAAIEKIRDAESLAFLIFSVDPSFQPDKFIKPYIQIESTARTLRSRIRAYIQPPDDPALAEFGRTLKEVLNDNGIMASRVREPENPDLIMISMSGEAQKYQLYGYKMVKIRLRFTIRTNRNEIVSSNHYEMKGASVLGFPEAIRAADVNFYRKLKKGNWYSVLGINGQNSN